MEKRIKAYLDQRAAEDPLFAATYTKENKNIKECCAYITSQAKKQAVSGCAKVKNLDDLPDEVVGCISSIKKVKGGIEVRFLDKIAAIDRLSRMLGWDEATTVKVQGSVPIQEWLNKFGNQDKEE